MKIGILGTRGIPNQYGGFEQFAEYLSVGLIERGHDVWVYNSSLHPYTETLWNGVHLIRCFDPENKIGTAGQFVYDLNCIRDARTRSFDVLLQLGYTSSSVWGPWLPENPVVFTNMDGLEWKRSKYNSITRKFLRRAEQWAIRTSNVLVADSLGIQKYLKSTYGQPSEFIPYGAEVFDDPVADKIAAYGVNPLDYYMLIARMEPENNIEVILDGYAESNDKRPFLVVGKASNKFGQKMQSKFAGYENIRFTGAIYDLDVLNNLRHYARLYFHGHSVGGTNPSLLEAMASGALVAAHGNPFNKAVVEGEAFYFSNAQEVSSIIHQLGSFESREQWIEKNRQKIIEKYQWDHIIDRYIEIFEKHLDQLS